MGTSSQTLKQRAYFELKEFLVIAFYLWIFFGAFIVYKSLVLSEHHIDFKYHGFALINALALVKVMLVAKDLHLGERFNKAPLVYLTLLKSALFTAVLACFKILEELAIGLYRRESFQQSIADFGGGTLKGILILIVLLFVVLMPFVAFGELQRVLGDDKLQLIFFHARPLENQPSKS